MRKYICAGGVCFLLMLCLCLMLALSGCNRVEVYEVPVYASHGNAWATDGNAKGEEPVFKMEEPLPTTTPVAVEVTIPPVEVKSTPMPQQTGEPVEMPVPVTTPEPTPPPVTQPTDVPPEYIAASIAGGEYNGLSAILNAVYYQKLDTESVLKAKYAAQVLDWYIESGRSAEAVQKGAMGWLKREGVMDPDTMQKYFADRQFIQRLDNLYAMAVSLFDENGKALLDAGSYVPANFPYAMTDVDAVFSLIYDAFGERKPQYVRLYRGEEYAGIIVASANKLDPFTLNKALVDADVLANEVSVLYQVDKDGTLLLDFSEAFLAQLKELDKEREEELMRSLVNTIAENLGYEKMLFTVKGETLKTEHHTYDKPFTEK